MSVQRTQVEVTVSGDEKAIADAKRVGREMESLEKLADRAKRKADQAQGAQAEMRGLQGLIGRAKARGLIRGDTLAFGALQLGRSGFGIRREMMMGAGAGTGSMGTALVATHAGIAGLDQVSHVVEWARVNDISNPLLVLNRLQATGLLQTIDIFGGGRAAAAVARIFGGEEAVEQQRQELEIAVPEFFGVGQVEERAERTAMRKRKQRLQELFAEMQETGRREIEAHFAELSEKAWKTWAGAVGNLRFEKRSIRLPRWVQEMEFRIARANADRANQKVQDELERAKTQALQNQGY